MKANRAKNAQEPNEESQRVAAQELQWIRKLLTLQVLSAGYKQKHVAKALGVSEATMSRMMPKGLPAFQNAKYSGKLND